MEPISIISGVIGGLAGMQLKRVQRWIASKNVKGFKAYLAGIILVTIPGCFIIFAYAYQNGIESLNAWVTGGFVGFALFIGAMTGWEIIQMVEINEIEAG